MNSIETAAPAARSPAGPLLNCPRESGCDARLQVLWDPNAWKCEESGATKNLWLNLSTGFIGSGREVTFQCV